MSGIRRGVSTNAGSAACAESGRRRGMRFRRTYGVLIGLTALALTVSACGAGKKSSGGGGGSSASGAGGAPITVGTTDKVVALDPAGSYDNGSLLVETQVYQYLMSIPAKAQT